MKARINFGIVILLIIDPDCLTDICRGTTVAEYHGGQMRDKTDNFCSKTEIV